MVTAANYTQKKYLGGDLVDVAEPLAIEPIGFTIILFLSLILILQSIGVYNNCAYVQM